MHSHERGEIHITLTPEQKVTYVSDSMLELLNVDPNDNEWIQALKTRPFFFLTEDDLPFFKECCQRAANDNIPIYFEHRLYDYRLRKIKMHGWISRIKNSDSFMIVEVADNNLDKSSRSVFFQAIEHVYDDVFEINTSIASVNILRNLGSIGYEGSSVLSLWDFKIFLLSRLIHPDDRDKYISFLDALDSAETPPGSTFECRMQARAGNTRWLQLTILQHQANEMLLCISDITQSKIAVKMQQRLKTDRVTKIMNREAFENMCCRFLREKAFENTYNVLLLIEIDRFEDFPLDKQDELLKRTGELLQSYLNTDALYARFGEKKFIVCFHDLKEKDNAKRTISDLFTFLRKHSDSHSIPGYSLGYAQCFHNPNKGYRCAFESANEALKDAIASGGNTSRDYDMLSSHSHISKLPHKVKIQTFGFFEVFVDGKPMLFKSKKAKELLAVLVDRRGGYVSSGDIISCLWENESANPTTNARCRKVAMLLKNTLAEYGVDYIIETADRQRRLVSDAVDCDLFHFLSGEGTFVSRYNGSYMLNYSWSEWTASYLNNIKYPG